MGLLSFLFDKKEKDYLFFHCKMEILRDDEDFSDPNNRWIYLTENFLNKNGKCKLFNYPEKQIYYVDYNKLECNNNVYCKNCLHFKYDPPCID